MRGEGSAAGPPPPTTGGVTSDPPVGQGFLSEMLHSAVAQKSEGSKNENKVGLCSSAINRKAFCLFVLSPEVTFGSLRRTSFEGVVVFIAFVF